MHTTNAGGIESIAVVESVGPAVVTSRTRKVPQSMADNMEEDKDDQDEDGPGDSFADGARMRKSPRIAKKHTPGVVDRREI